MKVKFIEAKTSINLTKFNTSKLPKKIGLLTTVQFLDEINQIKKYLESQDKKVFLGGQVLGCEFCNANKLESKVDAFLYVGSGRFHPVGIGLSTKKPVFTWYPGDNQLKVISAQDIEKIQKKKNGMLSKFLVSKIIGVLISTKNGQIGVQATMKKIFELNKKYPKKEFYFFMCNTLEFNELENFNFIECWINTMCPRISEDIRVLNFSDLKEIE
ncbi:hypothetical protein HN587_07270 [Candidatus Woesearchaeota archaeon]|jgi:2-(3-amino-3-carboxypropyl)histidine synthase|nr:hypothetical protein [Candidatus Woesearchaeota archaeon]